MQRSEISQISAITSTCGWIFLDGKPQAIPTLHYRQTVHPYRRVPDKVECVAANFPLLFGGRFMSLAIVFRLDGLRAFVAGSQYSAPDAIQRQVIPEPEPVFGAI